VLLRTAQAATLGNRYAACPVPRFAGRRALSRREQLFNAARKGSLILGLVVVFLTFGLPRGLDRDVSPVGLDPDAAFSKVCREHGGTPTRRPSTGTRPTPERSCTVRYGRRVYLMDAITPDGFDTDTARFQRQGCEESGRQQRADTAPGHRRSSFVYHPSTGVCERRP
jgi:hypothetical protein